LGGFIDAKTSLVPGFVCLVIQAAEGRSKRKGEKEGEDTIYLEDVDKEHLNLGQLEPDTTCAHLEGK
jgi:hypothetical protein